MVDWLIRVGEAKTREEAVEIGSELHLNNFVFHVTRDHTFKDEGLYYRFASDFDNADAGVCTFLYYYS